MFHCCCLIMLLICPYFRVQWCCIVFVLSMFAAYYLITTIKDNVSVQYITSYNTSEENASREKTKMWVDSYDQIKEATDCENKDPTFQFNSASGKFIICCFCFFGLSLVLCTLLFRFFYPESCKTVKLEKCQHIIVEKDCGCKIVYDPIEEP